MSEPLKRRPEDVKQDMVRIIEIYKSSFKDMQPGVPYFEGYRAALDTISEDIAKIKTDF